MSYHNRRYMHDKWKAQNQNKQMDNLIQFPQDTKKSKRKKLPAYAKVLLIIFTAYLSISIYNGFQENSATYAVNSFSRNVIGHDVLVNKGVTGQAWFYFAHPEANFNVLSRSPETRLAYASYEGLSVWDLNNFEAFLAANNIPTEPEVGDFGNFAPEIHINRDAPYSDYTFASPDELFKIENLEITGLDSNALWTDVTFTFDFISNQSLDSHRDNTGKVHISTFIEYYKNDGTVEISQTYGFDVLNDNKYSDTVPCDDATLTADRIVSITFDIFGFSSDFSVRKQL